MMIQNVSGITFCANFNSPILKFERDDFFVPIRGYGKNAFWAERAINTADTAVNLIRKNTSSENVIKFISANVRKAANLVQNIRYRNWAGKLRTARENWDYSTKYSEYEWTTSYKLQKYRAYSDKFEYVSNHPLKNPYEDFLDLTRPDVINKDLVHGKANKVNSALELVIQKYRNIFPKYTERDIAENELGSLNEDIAEIRWILAHSTPFMRGSDSISNILMRAMYKSVGVKSYPIKKGISLDLQAYCTELSDYKKNFISYFTKPPKIIE